MDSMRILHLIALIVVGCVHPPFPEVDILNEDEVGTVVYGYVAFEMLENTPVVLRQPPDSTHIYESASMDREVETRFLILFDERGQVTEVHVLNAEDLSIASVIRDQLYRLVMEPGYFEGQPVAFYRIVRISSRSVRDGGSARVLLPGIGSQSIAFNPSRTYSW